MTLKPCVQCGEPTNGSRCPEHRPKETRDRRARGYTDKWQQLSRRARRLQPFCTDCGSTEDLQGDHTPEAWEAHEAGRPITLAMIEVVCGACNRRRGSARPGTTRGSAPSGPVPPPAGKAQGAMNLTGVNF